MHSYAVVTVATWYCLTPTSRRQWYLTAVHLAWQLPSCKSYCTLRNGQMKFHNWSLIFEASDLYELKRKFRFDDFENMSRFIAIVPVFTNLIELEFSESLVKRLVAPFRFRILRRCKSNLPKLLIFVFCRNKNW